MLFTDSVNLWWHFGQLTIHVVIDQLERAMHWCDRAKQTVRGGGQCIAVIVLNKH